MRWRLRTAAVRAVAVATLLATTPVVVAAQYGHPLKGQWSGEWGPKDAPVRLLLDLGWDGTNVTGTINPGSPDEARVTKVTIDTSAVKTWKVRIEAERKDATGKAIRVVADGTLENLGVSYRALHGTWTEAGRTGEFTLTRN